MEAKVTTMPAANTIPLGMLFVVTAVLIMWLSARIVGVPNAGLFKSFIATIGVSLIVGAVVSAMSAFGPTVGLILGVVALIGSLWVLRLVFKITTLPAFLLFIVNIMVQMILISLYLRPYLHPVMKK